MYYFDLNLWRKPFSWCPRGFIFSLQGKMRSKEYNAASSASCDQTIQHLPFTPLKSSHGQLTKSLNVVFYKIINHYKLCLYPDGLTGCFRDAFPQTLMWVNALTKLCERDMLCNQKPKCWHMSFKPPLTCTDAEGLRVRAIDSTSYLTYKPLTSTQGKLKYMYI